jgi:hypothetical protein
MVSLFGSAGKERMKGWEMGIVRVVAKMDGQMEGNGGSEVDLYEPMA